MTKLTMVILLQVLLCAGPMVGVWEWMVEHCRRKEKAKLIHGNLALARRRLVGDHSLSVSRVVTAVGREWRGEREELLAERGRLIGDLHTVLAN
jgi:hypothetical protein